MALESATFINQFVPANPTLSDPKSQGDDHIRMIKSVLQSTFPNLTGAMTLTQAQINALGDTQLFFKPGMILLWSGIISSLPTGWLLCNGVGIISNGNPVPDLRDRFVMGAGGSVGQANIGGAASHTHSISVNGVGLTVNQLPPHTHASTGGGFIIAGPGVGNTVGGANIGTATTTASTGAGEAHTHPAFASTASNLPPWIAFAYIIKN